MTNQMIRRGRNYERAWRKRDLNLKGFVLNVFMDKKVFFIVYSVIIASSRDF